MVPRATAFKMFRASLMPLKCHHPRWRLNNRSEPRRIKTRIGADQSKRGREGRLKSNLSSHAKTREHKTSSAWNRTMNQGRFSNRSFGKFEKNFFMECLVALPLWREQRAVSPIGSFFQDKSCL